MTAAEKKKEIERLQNSIKALDPSKPSTASKKKRMQNKLKEIKAGTFKTGSDAVKSDMVKALKVAGYLVPAGLGINAIRLGYRAVQAGRKAAGLKRAADATVKANRTKAAQKVKTKGERAGENKLARDRAKVAANQQAKAKRMAKRSGEAAALTGVAAVVGSNIKSNKKTPKTPNTPNTPDKKPTGRSGNIGRTHMGDFATKAKVAPKPKTKRKPREFGAMTDYMNNRYNRRK